MPEPVLPVEEKPVDPATPETPVTPADPDKKDEVPYLQRLRNNSFQDLAQQGSDRNKAEKEKAEKEAAPVEPEKPVEPAAPASNATPIDPAEIAAKAAAEVIAKQDEAHQRRVDAERLEREAADKQKLEDERRTEALKPKFTGRDAKGNVVPKDYEELARESARVGKEEAMIEWEARQAAERSKLSAEEQQKQQAAEIQKKQREEFDQQLSAVIKEETDELFSSGKLPRIVNPADPNDPGNVALNELLKQGAMINEQRAKEGKPVITSLSRIYTSYYKLPKAAAVPPVQGNGSVTTPAGENKGYNFKRFHNMPLNQFLKEVAGRKQG